MEADAPAVRIRGSLNRGTARGTVMEAKCGESGRRWKRGLAHTSRAHGDRPLTVFNINHGFSC
jgi:hypothetical protein